MGSSDGWLSLLSSTGRRRFADWLPWRPFQDDQKRTGWFTGRYTALKWPPVSVFEWHQVDESIREPGIYRGYRPEISSWLECCQSLFTANNETLNFWTHFFPTFFFIWRAVQLGDKWGYDDEYAQPFLVYMITATLYPLMSAMAHGFSSLSPRARAICFFMDYAAISYYAYGSALLYRAYVIPDSWMTPTSTNIFLGMCAILSLVSTVLTCSSRAFIRNIVTQRLMRLAAFTLPYIWDSIPLAIRLSSCWLNIDTTTCATTESIRASRLHGAQFIIAMLASFCYASHLPERILPGRFDYVGHSHNLLHICGVTATTLQMSGALIDLELRRPYLIANNLALINSFWTVTVPALVFVGHILLVSGFGRYICKTEPLQTKAKCK